MQEMQSVTCNHCDKSFNWKEVKLCTCGRYLSPSTPYQPIFEMLLSLNQVKNSKWILKDDLQWDDFRNSMKRLLNEIPVQIFEKRSVPMTLYSNALLFMFENYWNLKMNKFDNKDIFDKSNCFIYFAETFATEQSFKTYIPVVTYYDERLERWVITPIIL